MLTDLTLVEKAKTLEFVSLWFDWMDQYLGALSLKRRLAYGYKAGLFYPNGARQDTAHEDWPDYFEDFSRLSLPPISVHALFCYDKYTSCQVFIDSNGKRFQSP